MQKECSTGQEGEGPFLDKKTGTSDEGMGANAKADPRSGPVAEEVESSDKRKDGSGERGTSNAGGRDMSDGNDRQRASP